MTRLLWLPEVLRKAGLKVVEEEGWQNRGYELGDVKGVLLHHTAGPREGNEPSLNTVKWGRSDLRGPLAQLFLARDGTYHVITSGRANHAGAGSFPGIKRGNSELIGIEAENTGLSNDPWPEKQLEAYTKGVAALLDRLDLPTRRALAHKEWTKRKIDPSFSIWGFRKRVDMARKKKTVMEDIKATFEPWIKPKEEIILPAPGTPADKVVTPPEVAPGKVDKWADIPTGEESPGLPSHETKPQTEEDVLELMDEIKPEAPKTAPLFAKSLLQKLGWKEYQAAALVAQAMAETGPDLNPNFEGPWMLDKKVVPKGTEGAEPSSFGIMKWFPARVKHLDWFATDLGEKEDIWQPKNSLEVQVRFIDWELRNTEKAANAALRASTDMMEACRAAVGYRRPTGWSAEAPENVKDWKDRLIYAYQLMEK